MNTHKLWMNTPKLWMNTQRFWMNTCKFSGSQNLQLTQQVCNSSISNDICEFFCVHQSILV